MIYYFPLEIATQTLESAPTIESFSLPHGILRETSIFFPWGCAGLAHVHIKHNERVLYPTNPDKWFSGNDILIEFECMYDLPESWNSFKIEGYNEDDFYPHTPIIALVVLPGDSVPFTSPQWIEG